MYTKLHFNEINDQSKNVEYKIIQHGQITLYRKCKITDNENIKYDAPSFFKEIKNKYGEPKYGLVDYTDKERMYVESYWVMYEKNMII